jgi:hypothetical protein
MARTFVKDVGSQEDISAHWRIEGATPLRGLTELYIHKQYYATADLKTKNLRGLSPQVNYTNAATTDCRRS